MQNAYEIYLIHEDGSKDILGHMEERHVTHNRYNEGLLIGAGKLHNSDKQKKTFLCQGAQRRNKAELEFKGCEKTFRGEFCLINFISETNTVVFGSVSTVREFCSRTGRQIVAEEDQEIEQEFARYIVAVA